MFTLKREDRWFLVGGADTFRWRIWSNSKSAVVFGYKLQNDNKLGRLRNLDIHKCWFCLIFLIGMWTILKDLSCFMEWLLIFCCVWPYFASFSTINCQNSTYVLIIFFGINDFTQNVYTIVPLHAISVKRQYADGRWFYLTQMKVVQGQRKCLKHHYKQIRKKEENVDLLQVEQV